MNEFTFTVLKAAICAAGKAFESVVNKLTRTVRY